ncbi:hypothetical protein B0H13DRAFT_1672629, partial [Mycena leptocephala]
MTDPHTQFYNSLHSIDDAHRKFNSRHDIIHQLWLHFRKSDPEGKFGVCLVRRHGTIDDGERMVAVGQVTQPQIPAAGVTYHPMRWDRNGQAFEFSLQPTECPPDSLLSEFRRIVGDLAVLGIFYVPVEDRRRVRHGFEHTQGRKNITR